MNQLIITHISAPRIQCPRSIEGARYAYMVGSPAQQNGCPLII